ncbi:MAG: ABC transporter substrate-binding protein [Alphaproteobacteria bacterium]|nr:ABC transporter substrate-binding protein [Alphaproteobacteria bacterium]
MSKKGLFFLNAVLAVLLFVSPQAHANEEQVKQFIIDAGNKTVNLLKDQSISDNAKEAKLTDIFLQTVDVNWIGRFVIGKSWRTASEEQKKHYQTDYKEFIISSYVPKFREYTNETFEVKRVHKDREDEYYVQTEIKRAGQQPMLVDYRVRKTGSQFKVFDIVAEGVSLLSTQRSDFTAAIQTDGLETFMSRLEKRTLELRAQNLSNQAKK